MKYALIGMGKSGESALRLLRARGVPDSDLLTFDDSPGRARFHNPDDLLSFAKELVLVVSPGYPLTKEWFTRALSSGARLTSEIGLAVEHLTSEKIIAVTGSVGKSTTVALLAEGLRSFSPRSFVGGNFGVPFCDYALSSLLGAARADWVVLELSSFQLENCGNLRPDFSGITSFTPNHMERYENLTHYYSTKWSLVERTAGLTLLNGASPELTRWAANHPGRWRIADRKSPSLSHFSLETSALLGTHNLDNLALAAELALVSGWPPSSIDAMKRFSGLPHRLENAGLMNGVLCINDSKATAIESVLTAVRGLDTQPGTLWVLVGGRDKNLPWVDLSSLGSPRRKFVFFGECGEKARASSGLQGAVYPSLKTALKAVRDQIPAGDCLLLSPGGSSLDEFKNFEERGDCFKEWVRSSGSHRPF